MRKQLKRAGGDVSTLPEAQKLSEALVFYYDAFVDLCTTRQSGFGASPISVLSVDQYCINRSYTEYRTYFLHRVVRELDPIYLKKVNDDSKTNKGGNKPRRTR